MKSTGCLAESVRGFFLDHRSALVMRGGAMRRSLPVLLLAALPSLAGGATINVAPGVGTLQAAIDAANPGDVLKLVPGIMGDPITSYVGPVVVSKRVRIQGGKVVSVIDAGCANAVALDVAADDVQLRNLAIIGGTTTGLRVAGRTGVKLQDMGIFTGAAGEFCQPTGAGIELDGVVRLSLKDVRASRFPIATSVAHLAAGAHVKLDRCGGDGNPTLVTGVLISDVQPGTLKLTTCQSAFASDAGIVLQSADGVRVQRSLIAGFPGSTRGIVVDADSDDNLFKDNEFQQDMVDVVDDGTSNCWKHNVQTAPSGPVTGNPSTAGCQ
jgi:hypothetical protein